MKIHVDLAFTGLVSSLQEIYDQNGTAALQVILVI